tara:strand:+ start:457 stop:1107 length:651 start_codon:yes stop_codon:yes gene_type:complete
MNFWNKVYKQNNHLSIWPWSQLISIINNHCYNIINNPKKKVLELGFGAGANIPFFLKQKSSYYGIDSSIIIVNRLKKKFKNLKNRLKCENFRANYFKAHRFDLIFDRASLTHNSKEDIIKATDIIYKKLNKGGFFVGVDWYSSKCSDFKKNNKENYIKFKKGNFANIGGVYFSQKKDINFFFKNFKIIYMHENIIKILIGNKKTVLSSWSFVALKK